MNESPPTQKPKKGCLFYGCLTLAILSLAVLVGGGLGLYLLYQKAEAFVNEYSSTDPVTLPEVGYTQDDLGAFEARLEGFAQGLGTDAPAVPLVLKGEDLNMLLALDPELKVFADGLRVSVEGDEIQGRMSMKLGDLGAPFFRERYLNGEASFKVSLENGRLTVSPSQIVVNGRPMPDQYLEGTRSQNFAESFNQDPDVQSTFEKLDTITVTNDTVIVVPKGAD